MKVSETCVKYEVIYSNITVCIYNGGKYRKLNAD